MELIVFITLIVIGYAAGTVAEKRHYKSIEEREKGLLHLPAIDIKTLPMDEASVTRAVMVTGNAVVAVDYFKRLLAGLRFIFGGRVKSYESLVDRARREAVLRMKQAAGSASIIVNVRIETSNIAKSRRKQTVTAVEAMAYGTAVTAAAQEPRP